MKVAVFCESPADEAAVRILVNAVLSQQTESVNFPLRSRGWPSVRDSLPAVLKRLHYSTDAEALVVVVDSDDSVIHQSAHEEPGGQDAECRVCDLRKELFHALGQVTPVAGRDPLKTAIGLAVPAIEAWYLCWTGDPRASEAAWLQGGKATRGRGYKNALKRAVYGTDRPSLTLETQRAEEAARGLANDLSLLESFFPDGFGVLLRSMRDW
jgi:hypothetical protein